MGLLEGLELALLLLRNQQVASSILAGGSSLFPNVLFRSSAYGMVVITTGKAADHAFAISCSCAT